jgi:DNA-binding transcriptional MerR regulator
LEKSPEAFRTISEVAEEISVPQHVLRFWESRFSQIKPMKRGGGRRYYRPDDVDLLRGVRHLLYGEGYTIRGVQRILREEGVSFVQTVWRTGNAPPPQPDDAEPDDVDADDAAEAVDATVDEAAMSAETEQSDDAQPSTLGLLSANAADRALPEATAPRREPTLLPPLTPKVAPAGLTEADRHRLQSVLDDLVACRRIIDVALTADYPDEGERRAD